MQRTNFFYNLNLERIEKLAKKYFEALFKSKVRVAQLRTRLGLSGLEIDGPKTAAKALFRVLHALYIDE